MPYESTNLDANHATLYENLKTGALTDFTEQGDDCVVDAAFLAFLLLDGFQLPPATVRLLSVRGARIRGSLNVEGATVDMMACFRECFFEEQLVLRHGRIKRFSLTACHLRGLSAGGVKVDGDLEISDGSLCHGSVDLEGATVDGTLRLSGSTVHAPGGQAVILSHARVNGSARMAETHVSGQLRMISLRVDGLLNLRAARVEHTTSSAIEAERAEVTESVFLQRGFEAIGNVAFDNATIGGGFDGTGSRFRHGSKTRCLNLGRAQVGRNISLKGARLDGDVRMLGTRASGSITLEGAEFVGAERTLNLDYSYSTRLRLGNSASMHEITLRSVEHRTLQDESGSWPARVALRGLVYRTVSDRLETTIVQRIAWLADDVDGFSPQPYEQLANTLRASGDDASARTVALHKQRVRRRHMTPPARIPGYVLDALVGYGYRNWYAALWFTATLALSTAALYRYQPMPLPTSSSQPARPFLLSLDLLLPIVDLGQEKNWLMSPPLGWFPSILTIVGWILTTAVIAGIARVLNRPS